MRPIRATALLAALLGLLLPQIATARTWTVETDGSGDFTVIQDAIDAAAPGDAILVGQGRFDAFRPVASTVDGFRLAAIVWVTTPNLTITGAGADLTTIGPASYLHEVEGLPAGGFYLDGGAVGAVVSDLAVENLRGAITVRDQVTLERMRGTNSDPAATFTVGILNGLGTRISHCEFFGGDAVLTGSGSGQVTVEDCKFERLGESGMAIAFSMGAQNCIARRCEMDTGGCGVQFHFGATGEVVDCTMRNQQVNIDLSSGWAVVRNCDLGTARMSLRAGSGRLEVYDTIIGGGTQATIASTADVYVRNSHILNAGAPSVWGRTSAAGRLIDVRENWWGTDDETLIESWIDDFYGTVLWQPILGTPVSGRPSSIGALKGKFGKG